MANDADLLRQYAEAKSQAAFSELVERHLALVYHCALRQLDGDSHQAEDVSQVVFALLAEKSLALRSHPSVAGWLYTTTHFKVSEARRAERRRRHREEIAMAAQETVMNQPMGARAGELGPLLDEAILELNDQDREAVLLRFFEGQSYADIAARLFLAEKTAHKRVERALERLHAFLNRRGVTSTAAALSANLAVHAGNAAPAGLAARVAAAAAVPKSASVFTLFQIMSTSKNITGVAALLAILAAGIAVRETGELNRAASALGVASQERAVLEARVQKLKQANDTAAGSQLIQGAGAIRVGSAQGADDNGANRTTGAGSGQVADGKTSQTGNSLNRNPQVRELLGKLVDWNNATYFGPLLVAAGLSSAQVARAEYLLGQRENFGGIGPAPLSFKTDPRSNAEIDEELRQVIGPAGANSLKSYLIVRHVTDAVAGNLVASDEPLTVQQANQLTAIVVSAQPKPVPDGSWYAPQNTDWPTALAQAQAILSPQQLSVLQEVAIVHNGMAPK